MNNSSSHYEKVSIRDVAKAAGVSIATVSRVINQTGPVSPETEERVRQAIREKRFVPSLVARGMRINRIPVIALLVENTKNEYFSDLATHLQRVFNAKGYFLMICATDYDPQIERATIDMLLAQQVSGIIIIAKDQAPDNIPDELPTVYIDCQEPDSRTRNAVRIESDNKNGGYLATMELIRKGCRHIAVFTAHDNAYTSRLRTEGYFAALLEVGLPIDLRYVFRFERFEYSNGAELTQQLLASGIECDGIFCICDYIVQGVMDTLMTHQIAVPDQMKVIGFDDIYLAQCGLKKLSTIHQSAKDTAQKTAEVIFDMIEGKAPASSHMIIPVYLVSRETT